MEWRDKAMLTSFALFVLALSLERSIYGPFWLPT